MKTAAVMVAVFISAGAAAQTPTPKPSAKKSSLAAASASTKDSTGKTETYRDLIQKAQNLTLQRDRLQTSQVLSRGIAREPNKSTVAYRELTRALEELTSVFYTEKAQSVFVAGESLYALKPKEALDQFAEALHLEEGNLAILKALSRTELVLAECAKADGYVKSAEALDPYSPEVKLLRLQVLDCSKNDDLLEPLLETADSDLEGLQKFVHAIELRELLRQKELKRAKSEVASWESQSPDYPEVYFWKWELSKQPTAGVSTPPVPDRGAALKYAQLCQNITPRKHKSYILDVDLCKGKDAVDAYLKESGLQQGAPPGDSP